MIFQTWFWFYIIRLYPAWSRGHPFSLQLVYVVHYYLFPLKRINLVQVFCMKYAHVMALSESYFKTFYDAVTSGITDWATENF